MTTKTPYDRSCNKTVRRFYDDFDLLPLVVKEMLWELPYSPTFDDVRIAWDLVEEAQEMKLTRHCFEKERKEADKRAAQLKKMNKKSPWQIRMENDAVRRRSRCVDVYRVTVRNPKDERLVQRVTEERALEMMSQRKATGDIKSVAPVTYTYLRTERVAEPEGPVPQDVSAIARDKPLPPLSLSKMLHNAGGKPF